LFAEETMAVRGSDVERTREMEVGWGTVGLDPHDGPVALMGPLAALMVMG
jgi:hypothetical protein